MRRVLALGLSLAAFLVALVGSPIVSGAAQAPAFNAPSAITFDFVAPGTTSAAKTVTVTNSGQAALSIDHLDWFGPSANDFKVVSESCTAKAVAPGSSCKVSVTFKPSAEGTRMAVLRFSDNTVCHNWVWFGGSGQATKAPVVATAAACDASVNDALDANRTSTPVSSQAVIGLPGSCVSRRKVRVHLKAPSGSTFTKVTVRLGNRTFKTLSGKSITSVVDLSGLPRGRFTLTIRATTSTGK